MQPPKMGIEDARRLYFRILHRSSVMHSRVVYKIKMYIKTDNICKALEHKKGHYFAEIADKIFGFKFQILLFELLH